MPEEITEELKEEFDYLYPSNLISDMKREVLELERKFSEDVRVQRARKSRRDNFESRGDIQEFIEAVRAANSAWNSAVIALSFVTENGLARDEVELLTSLKTEIGPYSFDLSPNRFYNSDETVDDNVMASELGWYDSSSYC